MPVFSRANVLVTRHAIPLAAVSAQIHTTGYKSSPKSLKSLFKRVGVYRDKDALVEDLCLNAVHVDTKRTGLVALNKPSSLPVRKSGDSRYSIEELLPRLAEAFEVKELHFVRAPERHSSGLFLLASTEACVARIRRSLNRAKQQGLLFDNYLSVTKAIPRMSGVTETIDVVMTHVGVREPLMPGKTHKEPVLYRTLHSKNRMEKRDLPSISRIHVHSAVVSRSGRGPAAIVSVQPTSTSGHFALVYLADLLSPVLGDEVYGYRAKMIMGVMTRVGHERAPHVPKEDLPQWMLDCLGLRAGEEYLIPKHLHLFRTALIGFGGRKSSEGERDLILHAPPPRHFLETAEALNLRFDLDEFISADKIQSRPTRDRKGAGKSEKSDDGESEFDGANESDIVIPGKGT